MVQRNSQKQEQYPRPYVPQVRKRNAKCSARIFLHERRQERDTGYILRDRGSLLFFLGERREEPLLATARFFDLAAVHGQGRIN